MFEIRESVGDPHTHTAEQLRNAELPSIDRVFYCIRKRINFPMGCSSSIQPLSVWVWSNLFQSVFVAMIGSHSLFHIYSVISNHKTMKS